VRVIFDTLTGEFSSSLMAGSASHMFRAQKLNNGWWRVFQTFTLGGTDKECFFRLALLDQTTMAALFKGDGVSGVYTYGAQLTLGDREESHISTTTDTVTRAADVVGAGAGLVYSNVPMVEPPYNMATTYAKDAAVYDPATKLVYWSMVAGNVGKALSDPAFWNKRTAINRWAMFDDRNSTQTSNPEEIVSVFSAQAITQGLFAGAMDASEVRVSMTHPTRGLVYSETKSLVLPRSGSSFFGWCFNRLRLRTWFLTLKLPVFANALVTVTIKKPGGVSKCGMCLLGPTIDVGLSLMGLSTELKDYSTTTFFTDGSSSTVESNFQYIVGDTLLFNFVIGCICYFVWRKYGRAVFSFWTALCVALVLTVVSLGISKYGLPRILSLGLPAGVIVLVFLFAEFENRNLTKPLLFLGSASYSIYLIHAVIAHWKHLFIGVGTRENDLTGLLLTALALASGCIFYVVVENPISRVLHERSKRAMPTATPLRKGSLNF